MITIATAAQIYYEVYCLYKSLVVPIPLFGCETLTRTSENKSVRRLPLVSYREHETNDQCTSGTLTLQTVKRRKLDWAGHVILHNTWLKLCLLKAPLKKVDSTVMWGRTDDKRQGEDWSPCAGPAHHFSRQAWVGPLSAVASTHVLSLHPKTTGSSQGTNEELTKNQINNKMMNSVSSYESLVGYSNDWVQLNTRCYFTKPGEILHEPTTSLNRGRNPACL